MWRPGVPIWVDLVRVPPSGSWEHRRADLFGLAEQWVGPPPELSENQAREHLVRRYLGAFGPAPAEDVADWAGMRLGALTLALRRLPLRRFRDEEGRELLDLPRAPLPPADSRAPVRFLPTREASLLVHARHTEILRSASASGSSTSGSRSRSRHSWSTAKSPERGAASTAAFASTRSSACRERSARSSKRRASG